MLKKLSQSLIIIATLVIFSLAPISLRVEAQDNIKYINGEVNIHLDGSATVKQVWQVEHDGSGTEHFIDMSEIKDLELADLKVSDNVHGEYRYRELWNVNDSFEAKQFRYGINPVGQGFEICFGKSSYEELTYTITYKLNNFVRQYSDQRKGFLIRLVNPDMKPAPQQVHFSFKLDNTELTQNNTKIWSFGNYGDIDFKDRQVLVNISDFSQNQHLTVMMEFLHSQLSPISKDHKSFAEVKEIALRDSNYDRDESSVSSSFFILGTILLFLLPGLIAHFTVKNTSNILIPKNIKMVNKKQPPYYRKIPVHGDLLINYYLYYACNKDKTKPIRNLHSALNLLAVKKGYMQLINSDNGKLHMLITDKTNEETGYFYAYLEALRSVAGTNKPFDKLNKTAAPLLKLNKMLRQEYLENSLQSGIIRNLETITSKNTDINKLKKVELTPLGLQESANVLALKRFFSDFTLLSERTSYEIKLWDNYLIFATLFGIGKQVLSQMEELVPDYKFTDSYENQQLVNSVFSASYFSSGLANVNVRSSGGGGLASFSGGAGFSGGGCGGGSR